jgi:DNA-binding beta-propeller fold protein YncE
MLTVRPYSEPLRCAHTRGWALLVAFALLVFSALSAVIPSRAGAFVASGSLSQLPSPSNCVSVEGAGGDLGCGTLIPSGLEDQVAIAVSPDGRDVYATGSNALIEFSRNQATGALTEIGCVTGGTVACAPENDQAKATAMNDPATVAISPNGDSVYVATEEAGAVVSFSRDPGTGLLTETGCISNGTGTKCAIEGAPGLKEPGKVQVSSDEKNVYVTSFG